MTTRIITSLIGNPELNPSFATVTGRGPHPMYTLEVKSTIKIIVPNFGGVCIFSGANSLLVSGRVYFFISGKLVVWAGILRGAPKNPIPFIIQTTNLPS